MNYKIVGTPFPAVECYIREGEGVITQNGGMSWMSPNIKMETNSNGIFRGIKRGFAGEKFFQNNYVCTKGEGVVAFASSFPGEIRAFQISKGNEMILQKRGFLASSRGVKMSIYFQKKLSGGLFGGEGFIMQRIYGDGVVFAEFDGSVIEYELAENQSILVDTGHVAAMSGTCTLSAKMISGVKNKLLGDEGFFNTKISGPGRVYLQTMPIWKIAEAIM